MRITVAYKVIGFQNDLDSTILHTAFHCDDIAPVSIQIKDVRVEMTDIQFHNEKTYNNDTNYTLSQGIHDDVEEFCNLKGICSDYAIVLTREWTSFRKKHSSLKDYRHLDQIELTEKMMQNFENHYLRTFSYMNMSLLKIQNVKYAQALISFLDFYVFTLMRDFYEELNDFHQEYLHVQDQKQKEKEIGSKIIATFGH